MLPRLVLEWGGVYWKAPGFGAFFYFLIAIAILSLLRFAMDRTAVFIDAGYLYAAGSKLVAGEKLARGDVHLDYDQALQFFTGLTKELTGLPLLRIYWYDGTATGPTPQQLALAYKPNVKLRLGFVNQQGQQKGVDSLIVTDLIDLARNRAMADALLLTGDEDIRVGVQQAQGFAVRAHLLGIQPFRDNQSGFLLQEADTCREITRLDLDTFLRRAHHAASSPVSIVPTGELQHEYIAERVLGELSPEEIAAVLSEASASNSVPAQIDRRLLVAGGQAIGGELSGVQKRQLRTTFIEKCRARLK